MSRLNEKLAANNEYQVKATFAIAFLEKQQKEIKKLSKSRGRTYTNLLSASNNGIGIKALQPAFNKCLNEAMMVAASADVNDNTMKQEAMKRYLQTYMQVA